MEESAQRRERLKAMRMEASQEATTHNDGIDHSAVSLSNPLLESTANPEGQVQSCAQSFNYYTDPMAAFSGNKQGSKVSPRIPPHDYSSTPPRSRTSETFPSPSLQPHINHSPNPRMQQPHGQYASPSYPYTSNTPHGGNFPSPRGNHGSGQGGYPSPGPRFNTTSVHVPGPGGYPSPSPQPHFTSGPGHGSGLGGYPSPQPGPRGYPSPSPGRGSGLGYPSPGPHFRNSPNHGSGQGGYPSSGPSQARGQWFSGSGSGGSGRGRGQGQWSGRGQGRGRGGAHNHVTAEERPDLFYNKSMVEDPWKFLEPVIWKSHKKPWVPNTKRPRVLESPRQSSSQPSLAEILAASFNDAANKEPSVG